MSSFKSLSGPLECFSRTYLIVMICLLSFSIRCFQYTTKCNRYYYIYQEFLAAASALKHANLIVYFMHVSSTIKYLVFWISSSRSYTARLKLHESASKILYNHTYTITAKWIPIRKLSVLKLYFGLFVSVFKLNRRELYTNNMF
jgi:ABC-type Fe3+ transport system permease subunit